MVKGFAIVPLNKLTPHLFIRVLQLSDIDTMVSSFAEASWHKPRATFEDYWQEQQKGARKVWVAYINDAFVGYVTLKWHSSYQSFAANHIPEIMDLNVLPQYRNCGAGSGLLEIAEKEAAIKSNVVGIGVGLYEDYGPAQKLYIKRGYIPDGKGITYNYQSKEFGTKIPLDDDLVLWLTKKLN